MEPEEHPDVAKALQVLQGVLEAAALEKLQCAERAARRHPLPRRAGTLPKRRMHDADRAERDGCRVYGCRVYGFQVLTVRCRGIHLAAGANVRAGGRQALCPSARFP